MASECNLRRFAVAPPAPVWARRPCLSLRGALRFLAPPGVCTSTWLMPAILSWLGLMSSGATRKHGSSTETASGSRFPDLLT